MRIIFASLALLALSLEAYAQPAAKAPEALLTAECIAYFRYDGYEPHRKAYDETAVAMAMKEGLSEFFEHVLQQIPLLINGTALRGNAKKDEPPRPQLDGFFDCLSKHGFVLGLEAAPPGRELRDVGEMFHVTIVFPHGADKKHRDALEKVFQLLAGALETPIAETSHAGRMVRSVPYADTHLAWWAEGPHLVCCVGTQPIGRTMAVIDGRQPNLTRATWYKEFASFKRYETDMRGYVDLAAIMDRVAIFGLEAQSLENYKERITRHMLMRHLGLTGLKDLTFHLGFDGKYQRSTVRLGVVEPKGRTGLLRLASGPIAYSVDKLPPLPPDADYVSVRHLDWGNWYDYIRTSYGLASIANLIKHHELPTRFPDLDQMIGGDFRKDFLDQLDTTVITYGGHSEGPFFLGQGFAVKVKDATKVRKGLAGLSAALGKIDDMFVAEKTTFRGQEMHSLSKLYLPVTYAVHNDWLIGGLFPQPVQGVILRSGGKYRAWKVPPEAQFALAKAENGGNKLIGASISDPRPVVQFGLSLLPIYAHVINKSVGTKVLDVNKFPNAQAVNEWLFPNTTMAYDDGNALRWEHHYSINEPDDFLLLLTIPYAAMLTDILPFRRVNLRANERVQPAFEPLPPPRRIPPEGDDKQPIMCRATAIEKDGAVQIRVEATRKVAYTVTSKEPFTISEKVLMNGVERTITKTAYRDVQAMHLKDVAVKSVLIADGKKVRVTRKDGVPVDAKDILASLEKSTQVVQGIGLTDIELVTWFPNQTQTYRVVVRNLGSTWNRYSMATN